MADDPNAGTTTPVDGDAAAVAPATGTTEAAGRDAGAEPDYKTMYLEAKSKVERVNELERLERERRSPQPTPVADDSQQRNDQIAELEAKAQSFAKEGDPVAALVIRERAERLRDQQVQLLAWQLRDMPTEIRDEVYNTFLKGNFTDMNHARDHIEGGKLRAENETLRQQIAAAQKRPEATPVPTGGREAPAPTTTKTKMSASEFRALEARTRAEKGHYAVMDLQGKVGGEIEITG